LLIIFSSMFFYEYPVEKLNEACEAAEYDGIEFWIETPHYWIDRDKEKLEEIKHLIKSVHCGVLDLNPCSVNEMIQEATLKTNLHGMDIAKAVKSPYTIHAGKRSALREPVEEDYKANEKYFRIISKTGRLKGVEILLENSEAKINNLCRSFEEIQWFARKFGFRITFDINHALKNGDAEKYVGLDLIRNVHVSSSDVDGKHVASRFSQDARRILEMLRDAGYDGIITVELDDLGYGNMGFRDKIEELKKERKFLESVFRD